ncbi:hypothetical protein B0H67DRAFT_672743 [Lasiosphaeris hirsuta]|uniref:Uncharacterized protein n=1 Tax=Lasiosphaeris hirsuta TaxID=260670 RepID=A0AA40A3K1_9PEZI|nr:hypothetical protein B0H67DRAFT_672743 [Lasiosphaeris hirsuta]
MAPTWAARRPRHAVVPVATLVMATCAAPKASYAAFPRRETQSAARRKAPAPSRLPSQFFVTETLTRTLTLTAGEARTSLFITTNTIVITLLNPTQRTQTATVTSTSFRAEKRSLGDASKASVAGLPAATQGPRREGVVVGRYVRPRQAVEDKQTPTLTSTIFAEVTTTVFAMNIIRTTLTNNVFSTTNVAPNAVTTVTVTTTVFLPSGANPTAPASSTVFVSSSPSASPVPAPDSPVATVTPPSSAPPPTPSFPSSSSPAGSPTGSSAASSTISSTSLSSLPPSSATAAPSTTASSTAATNPAPSTTATQSTPPPMEPMNGSGDNTPPSGRPLTSDQLAGIIVGAIFGFFALAYFLAVLIRRALRRRRSLQAAQRQRLTPPSPDPEGRRPPPSTILPLRRGRTLRDGPPTGSSGGALLSGGLGTDGSDSAVSGHSGLTGEGEVRIVIRPAPTRRAQSPRLWPMPPGHRGQTYSLFVEEGQTTATATATATGETTPQDPGAWSIASERGSIRDGRGGRQVYTTEEAGGYGLGLDLGDTGSLDLGGGGEGRPSMSTSGGPALSNISFGARSDGDRIVTVLTPPPAWHGHAAERGWPADPADVAEGAVGASAEQGSGSGSYPSLGIGKAK